MSPSPSPAGPWVGLLKHVLDDDQRTRRAELLLSHLTTCLVVIGTVVITTAALLASGPWWAPAGVGAGAISVGLAWLRRGRRLASCGPAHAPEQAPEVSAVNEGGSCRPDARPPDDDHPNELDTARDDQRQQRRAEPRNVGGDRRAAAGGEPIGVSASSSSLTTTAGA